MSLNVCTDQLAMLLAALCALLESRAAAGLGLAVLGALVFLAALVWTIWGNRNR